MGKALIAATLAHPELKLVGALDREGAECIGADAGTLAGAGEAGIAVSDDALQVLSQCDVLIDFTSPAASLALSELAAQARIVHVIGTTGFKPEDEETFRAAARHCRIVKSGNMSLGVNLVAGLVRRAAAALGPEFDIEVLEMHHRHKVDAPSGTALLLGEAAAEGRDVELSENSVRVRDGHTGPRPEGAIGFATLRGGSVVGEHSVIFAGDGEWIEIGHHALDRSIYTNGALKAALWAFDKKPGLYHMADVLGLH